MERSLVPTVPAAVATTATPTTTTVPPEPLPPVDQLSAIELETNLVTSLVRPVAVAWRPGDPAMYVAGLGGEVWRVQDGIKDPALVLDLRERVSEGAERGLLGIAFDPRDGRIYANYTDLGGHTHVRSWQLTDGYAELGSERLILQQDQPGPGHNGGHLVFDADGTLYISLGDGGGSSGRDAQDLSVLHGSILRITPNLYVAGYEVPDDNPFVGVDGVRPEIYAYGLRNPGRFSLDRSTGDLWIGDVGNESLEEIDYLPPDQAGADFGWFYFEGTNQRRNEVPDGSVGPVYEYSHEVGVSAIGGRRALRRQPGRRHLPVGGRLNLTTNSRQGPPETRRSDAAAKRRRGGGGGPREASRGLTTGGDTLAIVLEEIRPGNPPKRRRSEAEAAGCLKNGTVT